MPVSAFKTASPPLLQRLDTLERADNPSCGVARGWKGCSMNKSLLALAATSVVLTLVSGEARTQATVFPCDAFEMQPNGVLKVTKFVTVRDEGGRLVSLKLGASFSPNIEMAGVNIYGMYQEYCRR